MAQAAVALHPRACAGHAHRVARLHHGGLGARPQRDRAHRAAPPGQGDESRLHLWIVPADVRGVWRGPGMEVRIEQNFQNLDIEGASRATISGRNIAWEVGGARFSGRVEGSRMTGEVRHGCEPAFALTR